MRGELRCLNRLAGFPHLFARPLLGPFQGDERKRVVVAAAGGRTSIRSSISKPDRRRIRIQSPCERRNSTLGSPGHSKRYMPNAGRSSRSLAATPHSSGAQRHRYELTRKTRRPQGATGALPPEPTLRIGPQTGAVLGDGEVERAIRIGNRLGVAVEERKVEAVLKLQTSCRGQLRLRNCRCRRPAPAPRQPRRHIRRAAAELDGILARQVVRQQPDSDLGTPQIPQVGVCLAQAASPGPAYSLAHTSHATRLRRTCSGRSLNSFQGRLRSAFLCSIARLANGLCLLPESALFLANSRATAFIGAMTL